MKSTNVGFFVFGNDGKHWFSKFVQFAFLLENQCIEKIR